MVKDPSRDGFRPPSLAGAGETNPGEGKLHGEDHVREWGNMEFASAISLFQVRLDNREPRCLSSF